ncbi:hypothetical protein Q8W30_01950 [Neptunomonas phycophila]|uniref:Uncharacterized protein n=1 Tax=Neptunomonas phycophila TaxID=1572645 RepID=A0ABT9EQW7_9GAMM|nr:hypothetical protein [Neptunomonas phycophila]MDP2521320.1 hypothetical protein [Neptunomonas phycophila]
MRYLMLTIAALLAPFANAHPGHDHGHWLSEPIHLLTLAAIAAVLVATGWAIRQGARKIRARSTIKQEK